MPRKDPSISTAGCATLGFVWNGRSRIVPLGRWSLMGVVVALPTLAIGVLAAAAYFVFHDELLAAMMTRQAAMQYSYEDRIAALETQLDQQIIIGNTERGTIDTRLRRLDEKKEQLESRTTAIDGLVAHLVTGAAMSPVPMLSGARREPMERQPSTVSGGLRLEQDRAGADQHVETASTRASVARVDSLERSFDGLERRQMALLADVTTPTMQGVERMSVALAKTGLPLTRWHLGREVGGPFVPLSPASLGFDQTLALFRDAARQHERLGAIIDNVPLRQPLAGPLEVTSTFGARLDPFFGRPAMHTGVDFREAWGESVTATAAGVVTIAGADGGYGQMVEIDHGNGVRTRYAHLGGIAVSVNEKVSAGAVVGQVGSTGRATGPHLHYEVRIDGEPVDPTRFLAAGAALFPG